MHESGKADLLVKINNLVKSLDTWLTQNYYLPFAFWKSVRDQSQCVFKQTQLLRVFCLGLPLLPPQVCGTTAALLSAPCQEASFLAECIWRRSYRDRCVQNSLALALSLTECQNLNTIAENQIYSIRKPSGALSLLESSSQTKVCIPVCHSKRWWKPSLILTALVWPYDLVLEVSKLLAWVLVV